MTGVTQTECVWLGDDLKVKDEAQDEVASFCSTKQLSVSISRQASDVIQKWGRLLKEICSKAHE